MTPSKVMDMNIVAHGRNAGLVSVYFAGFLQSRDEGINQHN